MVVGWTDAIVVERSVAYGGRGSCGGASRGVCNGR